MKTFKQFTAKEEAVPVNAAGAGAVAGIGVGPYGEPPGKLAMLRRTIERRKKKEQGK